MISIEGIRATGLFLLETLQRDKTVKYSHFYNDRHGTAEMLTKGALPFVLQRDECDEVHLREEGHIMLETAAWQLEDIGIVRISKLTSTLIDGDNDFQIEITDEGERTSPEGLTYRFHDGEYSIDASPASEWLIALLNGVPGESLSLRVVMQYGDSEGDVVITDDFNNEYRWGTGTYAWAFEVALWHHARSGNVTPTFNSAEEAESWLHFMERTSRPPCPCTRDPHLHWDIPVRISDAFIKLKHKVRHVGRVR